jgi:molybdate ABC transporter permease protein
MHLDPSPLLISLATTFTATAATFVLGVCAARRLYGVRDSVRAWIDGGLTLPLVLPPTVVGFFLLLLFGRRSPIGQALEHIGVTIVFSWPATVIAATVVAFPLMYRTTIGAFEQVNPMLLDAARTLGASEWTVFRRVLVPLAAPGLVAGTVLAFARAMGEFGATLMLAGNIPGRTQTMPMAIFSAAEGGDMRVAGVWAALIVVLSMAIIRLLHYEAKTRPRHVEHEPPVNTTPIALAKRADETHGKLEAQLQRRLENFALHVELVAEQGAVGLLGPSGAGKSITLRMLAGVAKPDSGRVVLNRRVLYDSASGVHVPAAQRKIGVVFQDYALFPHMTVAENVAFSLRSLASAEREVRVEALLQSLKIAELRHRLPREISGGERQRVALARCLAMEPDALLFDEPFAALDPHLRRQTEEQLRATLASYNGAVVFVTHDMEEAFRFCTDLLVLDQGRVIASGAKHELFERPRSVAAARLTGCKNVAPAMRVGPRRIAVPQWECELETAVDASEELTHVGYRSHQLRFVEHLGEGVNVFPCWLVSSSEAPHEMTLYLRLHGAGDAAHVQADVAKELWRALSERPQPWFVQIAPERLLLLER